MATLLSILRSPRHWPWLVLVLAAAVLVTRLGHYGFVEPSEIQIADRALDKLETEEAPAGEAPADEAEAAPGGGSETSEPGMPSAPIARKHAAPAPTAGKPDAPPLTDELVAHGLALSQTEWGGRLPLVLVGLEAILACFFLGARLGRPRAGLIASLALLAMPLFVVQTRQLNSDIGAVAGTAMIMLGALGLLWPSRRSWLRAPLGEAVDVLVLAYGCVTAYFAAGAWNGLVPPLAGAGAAGLACLAFHPREDDGAGDAPFDRRARVRMLCTAAATLVAAVGVLAWIVHAVHARWVDHALWSSRYTHKPELPPGSDYVAALGGALRREPDGSASATGLFDQIGFGLFPWVALAPLALGHLAVGERDARRSFGGYAMFAWAILAWLAAAAFQGRVGPVHYSALVAIAVACGLFVDRLLEERAGGAAGEERGLGGPLPLHALFVLLCAIVLGRDIYNFPEQLTSINLPGPSLKYPTSMHLHGVFEILGALFGLALAAGLWLGGARDGAPAEGSWWRRLRVDPELRGRAAIGAAGAISVLVALFVAQAWVPGLSARLSSKHVFERFAALRQDGEPLGILGHPGSGPRYYLDGDFESLAQREDLIKFLTRPGRVFGLMRATELCPLHRAATTQHFGYHVLDVSNDQFLLISNQLRDGERDDNPLLETIVRTRPSGIARPLDVNFDDTIHLIGADFPDAVGRGDTFTLTLYLEIVKPISRNWKSFVHIDGGGVRIIGDHTLINGLCPTTSLLPGDFVVDRFEVKAGSLVEGTPKTTFQIFTGFFVGSAGNYTNMTAKSGHPDDNNRILIGTLRIQ